MAKVGWFAPCDMQELACDGAVPGFTVVENKLVDADRWSLIYEMVFRHDDTYYKVGYSRGATEYQDEQPFEGMDNVQAHEVVPQEYTAVKYVPA